MDRKCTISMVIGVVFFVAAAIWTLHYHGISYFSVFFAIVTLLYAVIILVGWNKLERGRRLGEDLFLSKFGVKPDRVKVLSGYTYKYDHLNGISTNSVRIRFWSQEKVYKGIVDIENEKLYIKEPELLPVYTGDVIPVWKDVTKVHRNGMPKTVAYHDADERPRGMDYLDKQGTLKKGSWRRYKGREVYWFPEKQVWEP